MSKSNSPKFTRYSFSTAFEWAGQFKWDYGYNGDIDRFRDVPEETALCAEHNIRIDKLFSPAHIPKRILYMLNHDSTRYLSILFQNAAL